MQDRSDRCRIERIQDKADEGHDGCRTGWMQDRSVAKKDGLRTGWIQDRTDQMQEDQMRDRMDAGQDK